MPKTTPRSPEQIINELKARCHETPSLPDVQQLILRALCDLTGADRGIFYLVVAHRGEMYTVESQGVGPSSYREACAGMTGTAMKELGLREDGSSAHPMLEAPFFSDDFMVGDAQQLAHLEIYRRYFLPNRIESILGKCLVKDAKFLGWYGVHQTADQAPFSRRDLARVSAYQAELDAIAVGSIEYDPWQPPARGVIGIFDGAGLLKHSSTDAPSWFKDGRVCRELRNAATALLEGDEAGQELLIRRSSVKLTRLVGDGEPLVEARLTTAPFARIPPEACLSPKQRAVAKQAAAGATVKEIAAALELSPETVRTHLKACYERLDVSNRVELALTLRKE